MTSEPYSTLAYLYSVPYHTVSDSIDFHIKLFVLFPRPKDGKILAALSLEVPEASIMIKVEKQLEATWK